MSNVGPEGRSYLPIEKNDLKTLLAIAERDRADFFKSHPQWARCYARRVICVALCQGAALHYLDGTTGINDFDVHTFYKSNPRKPWYAKRIKSYDFGDPKFGQSVNRPYFVGRRVDCLGRDFTVLGSDNATTALRRYLIEAKTVTARELAQEGVVLLEPNLGKIVWRGKSDG